MAIGVLVLVVNIIYSAFKGERVTEADPWDARTLEWSVPTPVPVYNFAQIPQVRSLDPLFYEKVHGDGTMKPAEPLGPIHMPNGSILPIIMAFGLATAGLGFVLMSPHAPEAVPRTVGLILAIGGLALNFLMMIVRSVKEDYGYYIPVEEIKEKEVS